MPRNSNQEDLIGRAEGLNLTQGNQLNDQDGHSQAPPHGENRIWSTNRQLALAGIKGNVRAHKFDGKDATSYHGWKNAIQLEVAGLEITAGEWLELLSLRTIKTIQSETIKTGSAQYVVPLVTIQMIFQTKSQLWKT